MRKYGIKMAVLSIMETLYIKLLYLDILRKKFLNSTPLSFLGLVTKSLDE